jgi:hypothetical protein
VSGRPDVSIVEEHTSGDGQPKLIVCRYDDGDAAIGFAGFPWHTHADILAALSGLNEPDAIQRFIDDVLEERAIMAVSRVDGMAGDVCITDDPAGALRYKSEDEAIEFRYWSSKRHP